MAFGRKRIYTDVAEITESNIIQVVRDAFIIHEQNRLDIKRLFDIAKGDMELSRKKEIRPEIDIKAVDPIASQITDFKIGYEHGTPITYIQRAMVESDNSEGAKDDLRIATLNEMMREVNKASKDLQLASYIKKCGVGYRFIFPNRKKNGISPFDMAILNPMNTFVIYSNDVFQKPLASVTYVIKNDGNKGNIGVYTDKFYFNIFDEKVLSKEINPIGIIPIVEYDNNDDIMGCFEKELQLIDALNVVTSDRVNDIAQTVQSILWLHNTKLSEEQKDALVDGGVIQTQQTADGKDAKIQYVNAPLNQAEIQTLADNLKERILESAGVPKLSDTTNTTGNATFLSNGWHTAETQAKSSELIWRMAEDITLDICLTFIRNSEISPNGVGSLKLADIDYKMHRSENYDIVSRVNAFVTLTDRGFDLVKSATYCKITDDPQQFCLDSQANVDKLRFNNSDNDAEKKTEESIQPDTVAF